MHTRDHDYPGRPNQHQNPFTCEWNVAPMCRLPNDFAEKKMFFFLLVTEKLYEKRIRQEAKLSYNMQRFSDTERERERERTTHTLRQLGTNGRTIDKKPLCKNEKWKNESFSMDLRQSFPLSLYRSLCVCAFVRI